MFVYLSNVYVEILTLNMMLQGGEAFRRWLGQKGGSLVNGIHALVKEPQLSGELSEKTAICEWGSRSHHTLNLDLDFPASKTVRSKCWCL